MTSWKPLHKLTESIKNFDWTDEYKNVFAKVFVYICSNFFRSQKLMVNLLGMRMPVTMELVVFFRKSKMQNNIQFVTLAKFCLNLNKTIPSRGKYFYRGKNSRTLLEIA